jgi:hypothetical protein
VSLGRGTIGTQTGAQKRSHSIFSLRTHSHDLDAKQETAHPSDNDALNFDRLIFVGKGKPDNQLHPRNYLMIAQDTEPVTTQVHYRSFSEKISAQVVHHATNGNSVIGTDHKLVSLRHGLVAISSFALIALAYLSARLSA